MNLVSFNYLFFLTISVLIYWSISSRRYRSLFLILASFLFSCSYSASYSLLFLVEAALVYAAAGFISREKRPKGKKMLLLFVLFYIAVNLYFFKYFNIAVQLPFAPYGKLPHAAAVFGASYISFRLIHFLVECYRQTIVSPSFVNFISYIMFFPTFLAGPVERFQSYNLQSNEGNSFSFQDINYGLIRIICGILKKVVVADILGRLIMPVLSLPQSYSRPIVILSVYGLAIRIYMDFSGYSDIAIGSARLFGYQIMENFNYPYLQKNIALCCRNWHISVYSWIRDYFFLPFFGFRASKIKIYVGIFCTMVVFMLWHRLSLNFLILGAYYGTGLVIWYLFQNYKRECPFIQRLVSKNWLDPLAVFFTFSFVSFGMVFFMPEFIQSWNILQRIMIF